MPWVPIKNFDEDVNKDSKVLAVGLECTVLFKSKNCLIVLNEKGEDFALSKDFVSHVWREPKQWRAENNEPFFFVRRNLTIGSTIDDYYPCDSDLHKIGNYFKTCEQAQKAAQKIKDLLAKFHEEEE